MNKIISTTFLMLFSFSLLAFQKSGNITISGKVENYAINTIEISHLSNQELVSAELDTDGNFSMSTSIEEGYFLLEYGRNTAYIYLYPEDKMNLTFDAKHFQKTLVFAGRGAVRNNYLAKKSVVNAELTKDLEAFYKVDEATYLKNLDKVKNADLALLDEYKVEAFFKREELKSLEYERLLDIKNFKSNYKFYLGDEISPSEGFYAPVKELNLDSSEDYRKQPYYRYLVNSAWNKRIEDAPNVDEMLKVFREVRSRDLAISLIYGFYSSISSKKERAKDYLDLIKRVITHKPFIDAAEKKYKEVIASNSLSKGAISPSFNYESVDGKNISLKDLKGKYVYIDVWATWCAPCIKQVPYLKKLEKRYHNKNIVFVSISVDKEKSKDIWKQMVKDKKLGGIQLFADKSFDSDFMNAYAVNSIPRFILIDPEGNIVDSEAPRPSFDKTLKLLDELVK